MRVLEAKAGTSEYEMAIPTPKQLNRGKCEVQQQLALVQDHL